MRDISVVKRLLQRCFLPLPIVLPLVLFCLQVSQSVLLLLRGVQILQELFPEAPPLRSRIVGLVTVNVLLEAHVCSTFFAGHDSDYLWRDHRRLLALPSLLISYALRCLHQRIVETSVHEVVCSDGRRRLLVQER